MIQLCICVATVLILAAMSLGANRRFARVRRLPMQWSLSGTVNWTAPRRIALAFMPVLAAGVLGILLILSMTTAPRPGQEGEVVPVTLGVALSFIAAHALHIWLIGRTVRAGND